MAEATKPVAEDEAAPADEQGAGDGEQGAGTEEKPSPPAIDRGRRWFSLSGAVPLAVFLVEHILTNASALGGESSFDRVVGRLQRLAILPVIEIVFIFAPLAFHVGYGIKLTREGPPKDVEPGLPQLLHRLLRISGFVVLAFVLVHLWHLRFQKLFFGLGGSAFYSKLTLDMSWTKWGVPWIAFGYLVGIAATTFHFAYGLITAAATWTRIPRRRAMIGGILLGAVLFVTASATVVGLSTGMRLWGSESQPGPCGSLVPSARRAPPARP